MENGHDGRQEAAGRWGAEYLVVSAKARELFVAHKVRHVSFEPLEYEREGAA